MKHSSDESRVVTVGIRTKRREKMDDWNQSICRMMMFVSAVACKLMMNDAGGMFSCTEGGQCGETPAVCDP